uniref:Uncharacterized protein n=1 Tax=Ananas comosus var. bracteatus TaxID=296719 RepID=A0A6V7QLL2_ANACO|nr:unnamed protein product [Ananas comosus var. bracteatus]
MLAAAAADAVVHAPPPLPSTAVTAPLQLAGPVPRIDPVPHPLALDEHEFHAVHGSDEAHEYVLAVARMVDYTVRGGELGGVVVAVEEHRGEEEELAKEDGVAVGALGVVPLVACRVKVVGPIKETEA